jgi:hypothetical protein
VIAGSFGIPADWRRWGPAELRFWFARAAGWMKRQAGK